MNDTIRLSYVQPHLSFSSKEVQTDKPTIYLCLSCLQKTNNTRQCQKRNRKVLKTRSNNSESTLNHGTGPLLSFNHNSFTEVMKEETHRWGRGHEISRTPLELLWYLEVRENGGYLLGTQTSVRTLSRRYLKL